MKKKIPMQVPYGAVYFRKMDPPQQDWARDYAQAAKDGMNIFRHWFLWSAIEVAPGVYDWADYDRQMDLAAENGIKVIIAEMTGVAPAWMFSQHPDAISVDKNGKRSEDSMAVSAAVGGGWNPVCLDTKAGKYYTARFLRALANRYKDHPALLGYDIWNECNYGHDFCYCEETKAEYRLWLQKKYQSLDELKGIWGRHSIVDWSDIQPPAKLEIYPETFDWLKFKKENIYKQLDWRIAQIKAEDPDSIIATHGTSQSLANMANGCSDEWLAAKNVDVYGLTFVQSRKGGEPCKHFAAVDVTRAGAKGKPFWHAEFQGGPLWLQPQVPGRTREDGRITQPEDVRIWSLTTFAGGARGMLCPRWRPLLRGPLFGAFGAYGMDGLPTDRSAQMSQMAIWSNAEQTKELFAAAPVQGDIGIVVVPESQTLSYLFATHKNEDCYFGAITGVYNAFFDLGIQADFVHIDDIDNYQKLYLPIPMMLERETANRLKEWVASGGQLFSEGCPAYMGDNGIVQTVQPGLHMNEVFGVSETWVEFTPDLLENETFTHPSGEIYKGYCQQYYKANGAEVLVETPEQDAYCTVNTYGAGKAFLIGTCPGLGYYKHNTQTQRSFFAWVAAQLSVTPAAQCEDLDVKVRAHQGEGGYFLWILNTARQEKTVSITLTGKLAGLNPSKTYWEGGSFVKENNVLEVTVSGRDGLILGLT